MSPEYATLSICRNFRQSKAAEVLRALRLHFPINELTKAQWDILECVADDRRQVSLNRIVTYKFCERVEHWEENDVFLLVTRYIEVNPFRRQILPIKTVRVLPSMYPVEMYLKNHNSVLKI